MADRNRFTHHQRLRRSEDFAAVYDSGQVASDAMLVIHAIRDPEKATRLGLSVSKRVGNSPERNRWKRLIREAFRLNYAELPNNLTIIVRPRKDAIPEASAIAESLVRLSRRLGRRV